MVRPDRTVEAIELLTSISTVYSGVFPVMLTDATFFTDPVVGDVTPYPGFLPRVFLTMDYFSVSPWRAVNPTADYKGVSACDTCFAELYYTFALPQCASAV